MKKFFQLKFIREFTEKFPFRQGQGERLAGNYLLKILNSYFLPFKIFTFKTYLPRYKKYYLLADDKKILAKPCCFYGGVINDKENIVSSLISSQKFIDTPNFNFNPKSKDISLSNFYFAPSLACSRKEICKVLKATKVRGYVKVDKYEHQSFHILVGNLRAPRVICFAHYDSIEKGATDNASGVAALLDIVIGHNDLLKENLFVFAANEELSYDFPVYWGHGFRVFEKKFYQAMNKAKKIIVVDCVGNGPANIITDLATVKLGFPIKHLNKWQKKIFFLSGDFAKLMSVYHSPLDDYRQLRKKFLDNAKAVLLANIKN